MFAIADKSISIQNLRYERKYRYVKSYVTTVVTATH